jgi:cytoskeletal protein CcmA (bactofilin family)
MFSKPSNQPQETPPAPRLEPVAPSPSSLGVQAKKGPSVIAADMTLEGNVTGGGELQIDGAIKGDVRAERVTIGETGQVDGGVFAEAVEVRGKVIGSITAKQVRLHGACHVDGDISHEQLAMEIGAFFQGRSLRLKRPATVTPPASPPKASSPPPPMEDDAKLLPGISKTPA